MDKEINLYKFYLNRGFKFCVFMLFLGNWAKPVQQKITLFGINLENFLRDDIRMD